jgi:ribosomal protein L11 methyltransferase
MDESLHCCRAQDLSLDSEVTAELLAALGLPCSTWSDHEGGGIWHCLYADTEAEAQAAARRLRREAQDWCSLGVRLGTIDVTRLRREDWAEAWKVHFPVQQVSPRLVIKPSWREHAAAPGELVIELDPGMSFGTGRHATSRFCLRQLDRLRRPGQPQALLDAGCGSGILTVAAVKLGYAPVAAFDADPGCILSTRENLRRNNIAENEVRVFQEDLRLLVLRRHFDAVVANLQTPILLACQQRLATVLAPDGILIVAGILAAEYPGLRTAFLDDGWQEEHADTEDGWTGGVFRRGG